MSSLIAIFIGGGCGAVSRFVLTRAISQQAFTTIPLGTLVVNVAGAMLIGFCFELLGGAVVPVALRSFIVIGENDRYKGKPLHEAIVLKARELDLAGATVLRGIMGFGADSRIKSARVLGVSTDLPIVIEIVDRPENVERLMPFLDEAIVEGLVTSETVSVVKYRHDVADAKR